MKQLLALLLAGIMVFALAACSNDDTYVEDEDIIESEDIIEDEEFDEEVEDDYEYEYEDLNDVKKVNMVYGDDKAVVTLNKPTGASFTMIDDPMGKNDIMTISANDYSWDGEIMGYKYYEKIGSNVPFVDYHFAGSVSEEKYISYEQEVTDLGITHMGKPVQVIKYTYQKVDEDEAYTEYFLGFEYNGKADKGLMGVKIFTDGKEFSENDFRTLFDELFFIER